MQMQMQMQMQLREREDCRPVPNYYSMVAQDRYGFGSGGVCLPKSSLRLRNSPEPEGTQ
jgi:hypothetical protein